MDTYGETEPVSYIVRWLIGNAPRQNVGGIAGSSPVLTTIEIEILNRFGIVS
jgi:hypothetical protein